MSFLYNLSSFFPLLSIFWWGMQRQKSGREDRDKEKGVKVSQTYSALGWCRDWKKKNIYIYICCPGGLFEFFLTVALYQPWALFKTSKGWIIGFAWQVTILTLPVNPAEKVTDILWDETPKRWVRRPVIRSQRRKIQKTMVLSPTAILSYLVCLLMVQGSPGPTTALYSSLAAGSGEVGAAGNVPGPGSDCLSPIGKKRSTALDSAVGLQLT